MVADNWFFTLHGLTTVRNLYQRSDIYTGYTIIRTVLSFVLVGPVRRYVAIARVQETPTLTDQDLQLMLRSKQGSHNVACSAGYICAASLEWH